MAFNKLTGRGFNFKDLSGKRFTRLTVTGFAEFRKRHSYWHCVCDCGNRAIVLGSSLSRGNHRSCGCLQKELSAAMLFVHGMTDTREYEAWLGARKRCRNPKDWAFNNYGGRGITICDEWHDSFSRFFADMGSCPDGHSLERIDNDKGYCLDNCRWATRTDQARNTRQSIRVTHNGETLSLGEWSERTGISAKVLGARHRRGIQPPLLFSPAVYGGRRNHT